MTTAEPMKYESATARLRNWDGGPPLQWAANVAADEVRAIIEEADISSHEQLITYLMSDEARDRIRFTHDRIREDSSEVGTVVHDAVEAFILTGERPDVPPNIGAFMDRFYRWVEEYEVEFEASELKVYNRTDGWAGTLDIIATLHAIGERALVDVKTSKSVSSKHFAQLALYERAEFAVARDDPDAFRIDPDRGNRWYEWHGPPERELELPPIDHVAVLHLREPTTKRGAHTTYSYIPGNTEGLYDFVHEHLVHLNNRSDRGIRQRPLNH